MEKQDSNHLLLKKAQAGNQEALESLFSGCRSSLEAYVRNRIGGHLQGEVEIEDVLQETYSQALNSIGRFKSTDDSSFLRWLRGIAEHVILNIARRQRINSILYVQFDKPSTTPTPSKVMRRKERFDRLEEAFNNLSPDYREAMSLVRIQGLQISEAAARMNRTPQAVKHLLIRAIKKLREALGNTESLSLPPKELGERRDEDARS